MKIQLLSDLHLEANPDFQARPAPDADLLVLAGDVGSYQRRRDGTTMAEADWGLRRFANWPVPVLFVPGNHEYDALDVDTALSQLRTTCDRLGLRWLDRETWVWRGVRFVGATLWTDYDAVRPPGTDRLVQREKAFRAANHYLSTMGSTRRGAPFDAAAMRELGLDAQAWLRNALASTHDGPTVVVTHFAPTLHSADPRYGLTPGTAGFCNALDDLLEHADLWLHGHLHCPTDVRVGRCRIKANPLGYHAKGEQAAFDPLCTVALPDAAS
ncbi:MAG: metallophosphoesterase [Hydrogenophaga sp.]|uniref:metallophosphoesterase n=1 Tax=Hydrogenophaga sp. TaxID=1904254 RepID=UPI001D648C54|nr:metallophosphoesterase [Hydrogenophaga sp.]MBX3608950.1 metallophosphoesterase [Hydrogenophaga sp.]